MFFRPQIWIITLQAALTPHERFNAVRQLNPSNGIGLLTNKWFVLLGWSVIILLLLLLIAVRQMRKEKETKRKEQRFKDHADSLNLTPQEQDLVKTIAQLAGIKQISLIFSMREAFNSGLIQLKQKVLAEKYDREEWMTLQTMILEIREKLGFSKNTLSGLNNSSAKGRTSRQIPAGTAVVMSPMKDMFKHVTHATITENDQFEILLECEEPVDCKSGDIWLVRFDRGAITWEFRGITVEHSERKLKLSHSDSIRFVSRRHFAHIAIKKPARIAVFDTFKKVTDDSTPFEFEFHSVQAVEIAGPCVRLETSVDLQVRQRVLIQFELEPDRIIQDVGEVREIQESETERSALVEMIGLTNKDIEELARLTTQILSIQEHHGVSKMSTREVYADV